MFFRPILNPNGEEALRADLAALADQLSLPIKNVRQWWYNDSIPGGWFERVAATGRATLDDLARAGTAREVATAGARSQRTDGQVRTGAAA